MFLVLPLLIYRNPLGSDLCSLSPRTASVTVTLSLMQFVLFNIKELEPLDCGSVE